MGLRRSVWVLVVLATLWAWNQTAAVTAHDLRQDEVRGLWVLRSSLTSPAKVDELVRLAAGGGYNTLLVQVRGRGDAYYSGGTEPRAEELRSAQGFDPLAYTITRARAAGLRVHAWFNTNLVSSAVRLPDDPAHVVRRHPEWVMVPQALASVLARRAPASQSYLSEIARWTRQQGEQVEGLYLSPITDGAQEYTLGVVRDLLARYTLDGLHLDYIRFPTPEFDYSAASLAAFATDHASRVAPDEQRRLNDRMSGDPLIWVRTFPEAWDQFRRRRLTRLVERIRAEVPAGGLTLSAAVLPVPEEARQRKLQDWAQWAERGLLDAICPMAYATDAAGFRRQVDATIQGAAGLPVWAGIGAWRLTTARTATAIQDARRKDVEGILLFSYDSLVTIGTRRGSYFSALKPVLVPERP